MKGLVFTRNINSVLFGKPTPALNITDQDSFSLILSVDLWKRIMHFLRIFTLQMLFAFLPLNYATQPCKSERSTYGFVLVGHLFKYFASENLLLCYNACKADPICQSLNYNLADNICEFSSEFRRSRPEHFQKRNMYVYAENPDRGE